LAELKERHTVKVIKPERRIFELLIERFGIEPHSDDVEANVAPPRGPSAFTDSDAGSLEALDRTKRRMLARDAPRPARLGGG
jgi:hypothetical protein